MKLRYPSFRIFCIQFRISSGDLSRTYYFSLLFPWLPVSHALNHGEWHVSAYPPHSERWCLKSVSLSNILSFQSDAASRAASVLRCWSEYCRSCSSFKIKKGKKRLISCFLAFWPVTKIFVECMWKVWYSVIRKGKHPLQSGCSQGCKCPYGHRLSCVADRIGIFIFAFSFSFGERQATPQSGYQRHITKLICRCKSRWFQKLSYNATSPPMYSGQPVIKHWEATTLSWALSYGFRHVTNIPFPTSHFNRFLQY